jgi:hypothetical protein
MPENPISIELQQFIAQHVHSVEQVEILCLLSEHPQQFFLVSEVFQKIQSSEKSVLDRLNRFAVEKLLTVDPGGGFRWSSNYQRLGTDLATVYRQRRLSIIELIYQRPTGPIHDFAEAFRLKKKD